MKHETQNIGERIRERIKNWGIEPKKTLGQNFLIDEDVYRLIAENTGADASDTIVEIGPGLGTLTEILAEGGQPVMAIEKDKFIAQKLKKLFGTSGNIEIITADILRFNPFEAGLDKKQFVVVGNIPYYLTSRLIKTIFETWPRLKQMLFMIQKEVAERLAASPPDMSLLAVMAQYYSKPEILSFVPASAFYPAPEVDSALIKFSPRQITDSPEFTKKIFQAAKAGFSRKRGQLINTLSAGLKLSREETAKILLENQIRPQQRAEEISVKQWQKLAESLTGY